MRPSPPEEMRMSVGLIDFSASLDFRATNLGANLLGTTDRLSATGLDFSQTNAISGPLAAHLSNQGAGSRNQVLQNNFLGSSSQARASSVQREMGTPVDAAINRDQNSSVSVFAAYHKNARPGSGKLPEFHAGTIESAEECMIPSAAQKPGPTITSVLFTSDQRKPHKSSNEELGDTN